jgi:hypothetical protein
MRRGAHPRIPHQEHLSREESKDMKYFLRVFCQNNNPISPEQTMGFIKDGFFFDHRSEFTLQTKDDRNWAIKIVYNKERDPVIISTSTDDKASQKEIEEIKFVLRLSKASETKELISKLVDSTVNVFTIEINQNQITDDCWEMLDATETFIMNQCDGILFTSDNEFFDRKLKKIYKL